LAVDARQIIDLKVGVAFSRFQSLYLKKRFQNLNQKMITFGPCQTPTLNFCVERHEEIAGFVAQAFYTASIV
jgi:DNA topoisomerase-3